MKAITLALILAAGLFGGMASHYVWPQAVQAQVQSVAPKEMRAQTFILVNDKGEAQAMFSSEISKTGDSVVRLTDPKGKELWRAGGTASLHPVSSSVYSK
jgi:hypothetical protein